MACKYLVKVAIGVDEHIDLDPGSSMILRSLGEKLGARGSQHHSRVAEGDTGQLVIGIGRGREHELLTQLFDEEVGRFIRIVADQDDREHVSDRRLTGQHRM